MSKCEKYYEVSILGSQSDNTSTSSNIDKEDTILTLKETYTKTNKQLYLNDVVNDIADQIEKLTSEGRKIRVTIYSE